MVSQLGQRSSLYLRVADGDDFDGLHVLWGHVDQLLIDSDEEGCDGGEISRLKTSLYALSSYSKRVNRCMGDSALLTHGSAALQ